MKTFNAKQFANIPTWQADQAAKRAKKQAKVTRKQRVNKRLQWVEGV